MDRVDAMNAFVAVAEARGFAPAARRLRISASAATRLVAGLEAHLGIRLLQRTTRSVSLTDAGSRYLDRARRILAALDEAESHARAEVAAPTGKLVVTAPQVFGRREVAPLLCEFLVAHPGVSAELHLGDRLENLLEEGIDLAVRIGVLEDSSLHARSVGKTRRVLVASPGYLSSHKRIRAPRDLQDHALIHLMALARGPEWTLGRGSRVQRIAFRPVLATNSAEAAIDHAERGGGITLALSYQVRDAVRAGRLRVVLPAYEPPPLPIQLVYPTARLASATLRAFIDLAVRTREWDFTRL